MPTNYAEAAVEQFYNLPEPAPKTHVLFIIGDWNAKVGSQEIPGVTGKLGLGVQNEAGKRLREFCKRTHWYTGHIIDSLPTTREKSLHMDITR